MTVNVDDEKSAADVDASIAAVVSSPFRRSPPSPARP